MRAKYIYEKFSQDSDPISDLNIGLAAQIDKWIKTTDEYKKGFTSKEEDYLWICSKHNQIDFVRYLLERGVNVHADNDAALRWASDDGHEQVVKLLLDAGADVHTHNDLALRWASENGHEQVVKLLLDAGANVHADNDAALRYASNNGHYKVIKLLKDHIAKEKKSVKESLNEKFTQDSDPVQDLGIGLYEVTIWLLSRKKDDISNSTIIQLIRKYNINYKIIKSKHTAQQGVISYYSLKIKFVGAKSNLLKLCDDFNKYNVISRFWYDHWISNIKLITKKINEKFTQDSDPVHDLGIGIYTIRNFEDRKDIVKFLIDFIPAILKTDKVPEDIAKSNTYLLNPVYINVLSEYIEKYIRINNENVDISTRWDVYNEMKHEFIERGYVHNYDPDKERVNEKFIPDSDPVKDLNIGIKALIKKWLDKMEIKKYVINDDLTIDVKSDFHSLAYYSYKVGVDLTYKLNGNLPEYINFNEVEGKFLCDHCNMTSLRGCPKIVHYYFSCSNNKLTSMDYMPEKTKNVYCYNNKRVFTVEEILDRCDVEITIFSSDKDKYDWINPDYVR